MRHHLYPHGMPYRILCNGTFQKSQEARSELGLASPHRTSLHNNRYGVPTWPPGITVRTFSPGKDDRAVFDATEDAFRDEPGYEPGNFAEWAYWLFTRDNFDPSLWFLAVDGDEIAGTALCRHDVGDRGGTGWIADVGVRPSRRKKGLGLALLQYAFGEFYRRGVRKCSLSVDVQNLSGAIRLYERAGMHPSRRAEIRYEKELRPRAEPHA